MTDGHVHTIPVDPSLTVEEAWQEIQLMGQRTTFTGTEQWANYSCDGIECSRVQTGTTARPELNDWPYYSTPRRLPEPPPRRPTPLTLQLLGALVIPVAAVAVAWGVSAGYGEHIAVGAVWLLLALTVASAVQS